MTSRKWWHPGPKYYVWLRWLFRQNHKVSPPDPKPWAKTQGGGERNMRGTNEHA